VGLADRFRKLMGIPAPVDPGALRQHAFDEALAAGDETACLERALVFSQAQEFKPALEAFIRLETRFPERRAEWLRWQGQTLYIAMAWRQATAAGRVQCYVQALECYFAAAELGERSQEFNVVELCEALFAEKDADPAQRDAFASRYLALFPAGDARKRIEGLLHRQS
jgi:hypothetical protein